MPTLNSEKTIRLSLESVARQTYPRECIEVLVADGGSSDSTLAIAREFDCTILHNIDVQPEHGKLLGLRHARGKYAVFLDSDEVLFSNTSLQDKTALLERHPEVKNVVTAGLKRPAGYSAMSDYANRYGEPFSYFMYGIDGGDYFSSMKRRFAASFEDEKALIVRFRDDDILPICDGGGHCFDLSYLQSIVPEIDEAVIPVIFPIIAMRTNRLAVIKGDFTLHYSTSTLSGFAKKINWRVASNLQRASGTEGFANREQFYPKAFKAKKYAFMVYGLTLIGPLYHGVLLSLRNRNVTFMLHFPLSIFTVLSICYNIAIAAFGANRPIGSYGK